MTGTVCRMNGRKLDLETAQYVISNYSNEWKELMDDTVYDECRKKISKNQVESDANMKIIKRFLYVWGRMGRVLGRYEFKNWEKKLKPEIMKNHEKLTEFRTLELLKTDLTKHKQDIKKCYDSFHSALGPIATAKTLHLLCPRFFPLWDNAIAAAFRSERIATKRIVQFSSEDYYYFIKDVKKFALKYEDILMSLSKKHNKNILRTIDEFAWLITHKPLSLF